MTGSLAVSNLGKAYRAEGGGWRRLKHLLTDAGAAPSHWVLRHVGFAISPGESVGLIGMNGAGKSTLLKMLAGVVTPTEGSVQSTGRLAAILELGVGFHPDFTGFENARMTAQIAGVPAARLERHLSGALEFAELGDYIHKPLRVYSTGMQMRLAFAALTEDRPDILLVDEAFSVGDAYFQHKSFERIRRYRDLGSTLVLVSHDKSAIQSACDRAILLHRGRVVNDGLPSDVFDHYNALLADQEGLNTLQVHTPAGLRTLSGTGDATFESIRLAGEDGQAVEVVQTGATLHLQARVQVHSEIPELVMGLAIKNRWGQDVFGINSLALGQCHDSLPAGASVSYDFSLQAHLGPGSYSVTVALHAGREHVERNYEWRDRALIFEVIPDSGPDFVGMTRLPVELRTTVSRT